MKLTELISNRIKTAINNLSYRLVPIGSVIGYYTNLYTNPPASLPKGWVSCNGQTLYDIDSPFNGKIIPNLNADSRILKGNSVSGAIANTILKYGAGGSIYNLNTIDIIWIMRVK